MTLQSNLTLDDRTLSILQELTQVNLDSRDGFREAAGNMEEASLVELFQDIARERENQAAELSALVSSCGESPQNAGSAIAAAHRAWIDLRAVLGGGAKAMLSEAERGEDYIKMKYEEALKNCTNYAITELLQRHYAAVKATHDAVCFMRDDWTE